MTIFYHEDGKKRIINVENPTLKNHEKRGLELAKINKKIIVKKLNIKIPKNLSNSQKQLRRFEKHLKKGPENTN